MISQVTILGKILCVEVNKSALQILLNDLDSEKQRDVNYMMKVTANIHSHWARIDTEGVKGIDVHALCTKCNETILLARNLKFRKELYP